MSVDTLVTLSVNISLSAEIRFILDWSTQHDFSPVDYIGCPVLVLLCEWKFRYEVFLVFLWIGSECIGFQLGMG